MYLRNWDSADGDQLVLAVGHRLGCGRGATMRGSDRGYCGEYLTTQTHERTMMLGTA